MVWLSVAKLLLSVGDRLLKRYNRFQLVELGVDKQLRSTLENTLELVEHGKRVDEAYDSMSSTQRKRLRNRYKGNE